MTWPWPWWAGLIVASPWLLAGLGAAATALFYRPKPDLADYTPPADDDSPSVSVIVPARNEALNIERCVSSLLASGYPEFEVVVVNDRSEDETLSILKRLAKKDERLVVINGAEKPYDWAGKPWACWQGFSKSVGDLLLFTDADTEHGPLLLGRAVSLLRAERADLVSVMPQQEMKSFWERLVQPFFFLLLGLRYGSPARMSRNTNPRDAIANGQFILVTRDSYQWIGGHKKVHDSIIEDLQLAAAYTDNGKVLRFAVADRDMKTRMYRSARDLVEGWSKNTFIGMMHTMGTPPLAALALVATMVVQAMLFLLPALTLALIPLQALPAIRALLSVEALQALQAVLVFGLSAWLGATLLIGAILVSAHENPLWALFHPLGALMQQRIFLRALLRGTQGIEWKGRKYTLG